MAIEAATPNFQNAITKRRKLETISQCRLAAHRPDGGDAPIFILEIFFIKKKLSC